MRIVPQLDGTMSPVRRIGVTTQPIVLRTMLTSPTRARDRRGELSDGRGESTGDPALYGAISRLHIFPEAVMRIPLQLLGTVVFLFPSTQLGAQQIGGTVIDIVTGDPVPAVTVELVDTTSAVVLSVEADDAGRFVLAVPAPGAYEIAAHHDGYGSTTSAPFELEQEDTLTVEYRMAPDVIVLNPVTVTASARRPSGRLGGFEERARRAAGGRFISREEIERRRPLHTSDLLVGMPGVQLVERGMGGNSVLLRGCAPAVFIDGIRVRGGASSIDDLVSPIEIAGIEVYRGPEVPVEFSGPGSGCGAILIWTQ